MRFVAISILTVLVLLGSAVCLAQITKPGRSAYLGFDRNDYPGDASLSALRHTFTFTGFWLNNPPGAKSNSWAGKRQRVRRAGFGFLVLFNGRTYAQLQGRAPAEQGASDGRAAVAAARREGFPPSTIIFLDQEEGGRLLQEQRLYLHAWIDTVNASGYQAGVYCSAVPFREGDGTVVITAEDIRRNAAQRKLYYWVSNDACPPSPGCMTDPPLNPANSGFPFAEVWQYAQSPRRKEMTAACANTYNNDGECYVPGISEQNKLQLDLNIATTSDPSRGRGTR
jgi:hypothetical protein